jgi:purine-binding chemotaxis protein CheW
VPAVSLRARFGFERLPYDVRTRLIVVQKAGRTVGLIVDAAREFVRIAAAGIQPPAEGLNGTSGRYLGGVATLGDRMVLILDVTELLNNDEILTAGAAATLQSSREK